AEGSFENGKPVGQHKKEPYFTYTYEEGKLRKVQEIDGKFLIAYKEDGSLDRAEHIYVVFGKKSGYYSGKIDKDEKPHDEAGVIYLNDEKAKVTTRFEHGKLKNGAKAVFDYFDDNILVTAHINEKLEMHGRVEIQNKTDNDGYSGFVHMLNGQPDFSKEAQLTFQNFYLSDDLRGKFQVSGRINMKNFGDGDFEGKDLQFSFANYPDTRFKGDLAITGFGVRPTGWHTVTEYKNGVAQASLKGRYSPKGHFLEGDNFYQKEKAWIYDSGYFTDNRNGKEYPYKTIVKENGQLITWMMEDLFYKNYTNEVWGYGTGSSRKNKCYYSKQKSKFACPRGWRLPNLDDVNYIKKQNKQDKKWITDNQTLISFLRLDRNGYVWEKYRGTEMHQEGEGIFFWLNSGSYISISRLDQGSFTSLDADDRFHTCRCVKDGAVKK
ncbi:MAG: hypothetical protein AAFU57_18075, partial [Bacteroidota bacterium]